MVYLDLSHLSADFLTRRLGGILEIYEMFVGDDPRKVPMKVFPGMHYSMGGLWVDYNLMTTVPGLFAGGECNYEYHGANRLGANALLSCTFDGLKGAPKIMSYCKALKKRTADVPSSVFERELKRVNGLFSHVKTMGGKENAYVLHRELGQWMTNNVTVVRYNKDLEATMNKLSELEERARNIGRVDTGGTYNQELRFIYNFVNMLELARVITKGALLRNESRGAHYKPEFPDRTDDTWLKTTKAAWTPEGPSISYEQVDTRFIKPRKRVYNVDKKDSVAVTSKANGTAAHV
jgi:succinate dehydrogenase / fumarate reductase flavoprotein subunit